jgi:hypothetical protein
MANQIVFPINPLKYAAVMTSISQERRLSYKEIKLSTQGKMLLSFVVSQKQLGFSLLPCQLPKSKLSLEWAVRGWW